MLLIRSALVLILSFTLFACSDSSTPTDGGPTDGGSTDGGSTVDSAAPDAASDPDLGADCDEECLCEGTAGTWDEGSCGHYSCGMPPLCDAIIPGCDCGAGETFVDEMGCQPDPGC